MPAGPLLEFGPFRLDVGGRMLLRAGERLPIPPRAADLLIALVLNRGRAVGREELLRGVWTDANVEEGSLTSHISLLRRILGETRTGIRYIETIPKRGYRFLLPVEQVGLGEIRAEPERPMLAVLPFVNLSGEKQNFFSDGLTEEAITHLGRLAPERLGVIARGSVARYKETTKSIREIGAELGVSHVLEGSVRRSGNRVRITAQLIQVSDQTHLWTDSYDRDLADLLALQDELGRAIAGEIEIKLAASAPGPGSSSPIDSGAYEDYLKGRHFWNRRTLEDVRKSIRYFESSVRREPGYADAHSGLADAYMTLHDDGHMAPDEARAKAETAALAALRLAPTLAEAHTSLAHVRFHDFDWRAAETGFRRAITENRNYGAARFYYANFLVAFGRFDEAVAQAREALRLDPVSLPAGLNLAGVYYQAGRSEVSIEHCERVLEMDPGFAAAHEHLGRAYAHQERYGEAIAAFEKAVELSGRVSKHLSSLAHACAAAGRRKRARDLLFELEARAREDYVSPHALAVVHAALGARDRAFEYLKKALAERSAPMPFVHVNPQLEPLYSEQRFRDLVAGMGLPFVRSSRSGRTSPGRAGGRRTRKPALRAHRRPADP
ncbi:MAG TPA: tetratricopeptide repeat protein [Thermoanaerobaculia bacterium]|nr:tetratricopeptide repeat protein [Thermoanaerobaculia bacterium]